MARKKGRKTTTRRAKRTVRARRASPVRRRAPRKAPAAPRRRRSNPKGIMDQPALKYGGAALAGALVASWANKPEGALDGLLNPLTMLNTDSSSADFGKRVMLKSTALGLVTIAAGWWGTKGQTRALLLSAGVGMLVPQAQAAVTNALADETDTAAEQFRRAPRQLRPPRMVYGVPKAGSPARKLHAINSGLITT